MFSVNNIPYFLWLNKVILMHAIFLCVHVTKNSFFYVFYKKVLTTLPLEKFKNGGNSTSTLATVDISACDFNEYSNLHGDNKETYKSSLKAGQFWG